MGQPVDQEEVLAEEASTAQNLKAREDRADLLLRAWRQVQLSRASKGARAPSEVADKGLTVAAD